MRIMENVLWLMSYEKHLSKKTLKKIIYILVNLEIRLVEK